MLPKAVSSNPKVAPSSSVDPKVWGPSVWASMHLLARKADTDNHNDAFCEFVKSLESLLPCETCRVDYVSWVRQHGLPKKTQAFVWTVDLHNFVNSKLGLPTISHVDANALWTTSENCSYKCNTTLGTPATQDRLMDHDSPSNQPIFPLSEPVSWSIVLIFVLILGLSVYSRKHTVKKANGASVAGLALEKTE